MKEEARVKTLYAYMYVCIRYIRVYGCVYIYRYIYIWIYGYIYI